MGRLGRATCTLDLKSANQCWTEDQISTAVAEDLRPTATATVAEVLFVFFLVFFPKWRLKCVFHYTGATLD